MGPNGGTAILILGLDGSERRSVSGYLPETADPAWSPDGKRIVFSAVSGSEWVPFEVRPDGKGLHEESGFDGCTFGFGWSPDGRRLAFVVRQPDDSAVPYVTDRRLDDAQRMPTNDAGFWGLAWTADGRSLVHATNADTPHLRTIRIGAHSSQGLLSDGRTGLEPSVSSSSPNGSPGAQNPVAFASDRDGNYEVYTMSADGSRQTRVTETTGADLASTWSPTGVLAYADTGTFGTTINAYDHRTGQTRRLAALPGEAVQELRWSPGGTRILLILHVGSHTSAALIPAGGGAPHVIASDVDEADWYADGRGILLLRRGRASRLWWVRPDDSRSTFSSTAASPSLQRAPPRPATTFSSVPATATAGRRCMSFRWGRLPAASLPAAAGTCSPPTRRPATRSPTCTAGSPERSSMKPRSLWRTSRTRRAAGW